MKKTTLFAEILILSAIIHYFILLSLDKETTEQQYISIFILIVMSYFNKIYWLTKKK